LGSKVKGRRGEILVGRTTVWEERRRGGGYLIVNGRYPPFKNGGALSTFISAAIFFAIEMLFF